MPGVFRPQTLADVLGVIQQQAVGNTDTSVSGIGSFAETAEPVASADFASAAAGTSPAWDAGTWGAFIWA